MKNNTLSLWAIIISIIAIGFSALKITPFEVTNDVYVGVVATFVGISVTLVIGYQIINTIEIKKEITEQRKTADNLQKISDELKITIHKQKCEMQEGFDIMNVLQNHQDHLSIYSFRSLHNTLLRSVQTDREDYDWIFSLLRKYISEIKSNNFGGGLVHTGDGRHTCCTPDSPFFKMELKDIVSTFTSDIYNNEELIRQSENFCRIRIGYDQVMTEFRKRIDGLLEDPLRELTWEEKLAITDQAEYIRLKLKENTQQ